MVSEGEVNEGDVSTDLPKKRNRGRFSVSFTPSKTLYLQGFQTPFRNPFNARRVPLNALQFSKKRQLRHFF